MCCPSELDQSAAETLGSTAGFPNSFQTTTLCVSSATVCRFVFAASGRRLVQLQPPLCLCWGLLDASRLPPVSSFQKMSLSCPFAKTSQMSAVFFSSLLHHRWAPLHGRARGETVQHSRPRRTDVKGKESVGSSGGLVIPAAA